METFFLFMQAIPPLFLFFIAYLLYFKTVRTRLMQISSFVVLSAGLVFAYLFVQNTYYSLQQFALEKALDNRGVKTLAYVDKVNKDYTLQVNHLVQFTNVCYNYSVRGKDYDSCYTVNTTWVEKYNIKKGDMVKIKYLPTDPDTSIIIHRMGDVNKTKIREEYNPTADKSQRDPEL